MRQPFCGSTLNVRVFFGYVIPQDQWNNSYKVPLNKQRQTKVFKTIYSYSYSTNFNVSTINLQMNTKIYKLYHFGTFYT